MSKFRDWLFDVFVVVGRVEQRLAESLKQMVVKDNVVKAEDVPPRAHEDIGARLK